MVVFLGEGQWEKKDKASGNPIRVESQLEPSFKLTPPGSSGNQNYTIESIPLGVMGLSIYISRLDSVVRVGQGPGEPGQDMASIYYGGHC